MNKDKLLYNKLLHRARQDARQERLCLNQARKDKDWRMISLAELNLKQLADQIMYYYDQLHAS